MRRRSFHYSGPETEKDLSALSLNAVGRMDEVDLRRGGRAVEAFRNIQEDLLSG